MVSRSAWHRFGMRDPSGSGSFHVGVSDPKPEPELWAKISGTTPTALQTIKGLHHCLPASRARQYRKPFANVRSFS